MHALLFSVLPAGSSNISSSSSSTRSTAESASAVNASDTVNGSQVVAVGMPLATVSTVATGHQNQVVVSEIA